MTYSEQSEIKLDEKQQEIAEQIIERVRKGLHSNLAGLAGTGKTTVGQYLYHFFVSKGLNVIAMAPTGKAASVLRKKGVEAHTLHSVIYNFRGSKIQDDGKEHLIFRKKDGKIQADLMMIDETSMITKRQFFDVMEHGVPTFWMGDPGQLPPVNAESSGILDKPMFALTKIHRQAEGNPIIAWAHELRRGQSIRAPFKGINHVKTDGTGRTIIDCFFREDIDVLIVKTNEQRCVLNRLVRERMGRTGVLPVVGDRLICIANSKFYGLINGDMLEVVASPMNSRMRVCRLSDGEEMDISFAPEQFYREKRLNSDDLKSLDHNPFVTCLVDYGYSITCHKMQGSSAPHVGIVAKGPCSDTRAWGYTSATRAEEQVTVFC